MENKEDRTIKSEKANISDFQGIYNPQNALQGKPSESRLNGNLEPRMATENKQVNRTENNQVNIPVAIENNQQTTRKFSNELRSNISFIKPQAPTPNVEIFFTIFFLICIAVGVVLHIVPYFFNRSLWIDEATLSSSIINRNLFNLTSSPLDYGQSAPMGWLYLAKLITCVLGTSEFGLRFVSLLGAFACILLVYLLLKDKVKQNYALFITAIFALTDGFIYYGNEFKPYIFDCLACLLVLLMWQKYRDKKISLLVCTVILAVLIWFSFLGVFFIAACMIVECFRQFKKLIKEKDTSAIKFLLLCGIVLVSFLLNYFFCLSSSAENANGTAYWNLLKFPLIPKSIDDLRLIKMMFWQFFECYSKPITCVLIILFLVYIVICIKRKKDSSHIVLPFFISLALLFIASSLGFYPIKNRLILAYQIVVLVIAGFACNEIGALIKEKVKTKVNWVSILYKAALLVCLVVVGAAGIRNVDVNHVCKNGSEVHESIKYLKENATENDVVYVYRKSIPVYQYETGKYYYKHYKDMPKEPVYVNENTIYAQDLVKGLFQKPYSYAFKGNFENIKQDSAVIAENDSVYLFASNGEAGLKWVIEELEKQGTVKKVVSSHKTYLYHFVKNK